MWPKICSLFFLKTKDNYVTHIQRNCQRSKISLLWYTELHLCHIQLLDFQLTWNNSLQLFFNPCVLLLERRSFGDSLKAVPVRSTKRFLQDFTNPLSPKLPKIPRHSTDGNLFHPFIICSYYSYYHSYRICFAFIQSQGKYIYQSIHESL